MTSTGEGGGVVLCFFRLFREDGSRETSDAGLFIVGHLSEKCAQKAQITIPPKSPDHRQYAGPGQNLHRFAPESPNWLQIPGILRKTVDRLVAMVFQKPIFTRDIPEKSLTGRPQKSDSSSSGPRFTCCTNLSVNACRQETEQGDIVIQNCFSSEALK